MSDSGEMAGDLRAHLATCQELLGIITRENQELREPNSSSAFEFYQSRRNLLPRLDHALGRLRKHRADWHRLGPLERRQTPEIASLMRTLQELIMKSILLDRENEQALLRRGLLPAHQLPSARRQQPHFVADLYRRHAGSL